MNKEKKEKDIISLIESSIKNGNANINLFAVNLIINLRKIISNDNLKTIIIKRLSEKNIYFLRHAEAEHNVLERIYKGDFNKCNIYDPELTRNGINQTMKTIEKLKKQNIKFDSIFVSPLRRAIQTYFLVKNCLDKSTQVFITDFIREVVTYCDKNKGIPLSILKKDLKNENINFNYMTKEFWWYDFGKNKRNELEGNFKFGIRLRLFILWLIFRPEKNFLIVSHSHVHMHLQDKGIINAGLAKMDNRILLNKTLELVYIKIIETNEKNKPKKK